MQCISIFKNFVRQPRNRPLIRPLSGVEGLTFTLCLILTLTLTSFSQCPEYLQAETLVQGLKIPWDLDLDDQGYIWFSERDGNINRLNPKTGELKLIHWEESTFQSFENSGMHALSLHPLFPDSNYVYAHYNINMYRSHLTRFEYDAQSDSLKNPVELNEFGGNSSHNGSRIVWQNDSVFFMCIGDAYTYEQFPQDTSHNNGKVLRMRYDGKAPADNPREGSLVWSIGHRNPQGLCLGPTGLLYSSEHGPEQDDEVNLIEKFRNYGWPKVLGFCDSEDEMAFCDSMNVVEPLLIWRPTQAPTGITYYNHKAIPEWSGKLILGFLKEMHLKALTLSDDGRAVIAQDSCFKNTFGRIRDVLVYPDGSVILATSNREILGRRNANISDDRLIRLYNPKVHTTWTAEKEFNSWRVVQYPSADSATIFCGNPQNVECLIQSGDQLKSADLSEKTTLNREEWGSGIHNIFIRRNNEWKCETIIFY